MPEQADTQASKPRRIEMSLGAEPRSAHAAREAVAQLDLPTKILADAQLLVSEVVSNSIRHSGLGSEEKIGLLAEWNGRKFRAAVTDGPRRPGHVVVVGSIRPEPGTESGWGLFLVDQVADRWGTEVGQVVRYWFEIDLKQAEASD